MWRSFYMLARIAKYDLNTNMGVTLDALDENELIKKENKEKLFEILKNHPQIVYLGISMNDIDDELLEGLTWIPTLKALNLCAIELSEKQAKILASSELEEIWVTRDEVKKVYHAFNDNPALSVMIPPYDEQNQAYIRKKSEIRDATKLLLSNGYSITHEFNPNSSSQTQNNDIEQQKTTKESQNNCRM